MTDVQSKPMERISVLEASRRSGLPAASIYRSIDGGELVGFRVGSEIQVRVGDLAKLATQASG
jgi:hypothetical protein